MKFGEEGVGVVGAGGGLGVVLHGEDGAVFEAEAFDGLVVEVDLGDDGAVFFEFFPGGGEAVILGGDGDFSGLEILDGLVATAVPEFELEGFGAEGVGDDLVTEADAKGGVMVDEFAHGAVGVGDGGGIAGAVGKEESLGIKFADGLGGSVGREDVDVEAVLLKAAIDGVFGAKVEGGNFETLLGNGGGVDVGADNGKGSAGLAAGGPIVGGGGGDFLDEIDSDESAEIAGFGDGFLVIEAFGAEAGVEGTGDAKFFGDGTGIDAFEAGNARFGKVVLYGLVAPPITGEGADLTHHEAADLGAVGFNILGANAVVPDLDGGHGDDLGEIGGIGQDFLITGHAGIETGLSGLGGGGSKGASAENCSVFKCEYSFFKTVCHASGGEKREFGGMQPFMRK